MQEIQNDEQFAERLIKLDNSFVMFDNEEDSVIQEYKNKIESDLIIHNYEWMQERVSNIRNELYSKIDKEDPDYLGHFIVECDTLLQYLEKR